MKYREVSSFVKINSNTRKKQKMSRFYPSNLATVRRSGTWDLSDPCAGFNDDCQTVAWLILSGLYPSGLQTCRFLTGMQRLKKQDCTKITDHRGMLCNDFVMHRQ